MTKILVIEDTHHLRKDILEMLSFEGFEVRGADNGQAGVQAAREFIPDLIICDILMPGMDGYDVLAELKLDVTLSTIPFIFLTAKAEKSDIRKGMEMGAYDYVTKPFTAAELMTAVHTQLQRRESLNRLSDKRLEDLRENILLALPHEIRTPLTSILGFSDIIAADSYDREPEQIAEMAQYISDAGARLYRLTENYLAYAQLEVMVTNPAWQEVLHTYSTADPGAVVEEAALQKAQAMHRQADLLVDMNANASVAVLPDHLKKMVEELADNAFKFSECGTPVTVSAQMDAYRFRVLVRDQGRGMTPEQILSVGAYMQFDRQWFEQQGLGLGLVITRRLARLYGGDIAIESRADQYTQVTLTLPLA